MKHTRGELEVSKREPQSASGGSGVWALAAARRGDPRRQVVTAAGAALQRERQRDAEAAAGGGDGGGLIPVADCRDGAGRGPVVDAGSLESCAAPDHRPRAGQNHDV